MHVCIVTQQLIHSDGQGRINLEIARYLVHKGHLVTVISTTIDERLRASPNITWHELQIPNWVQTNLLENQIFAWKAQRILNSMPKPDILQLNGFITFQPADVNIAMFVHSDWIQSPFHIARHRGGAYGAYQRFYTVYNAWRERRAFRISRAIVALSEQVKNSLIQYAGCPPEQIGIIVPGVNAQEFTPRPRSAEDPLRRELNLNLDTFLLFFTGDIVSNRKNLDLVLQALARLPEQVHVAVAGRLPGSPYPAMAEKMGIAHRVHFLGYRKDVAHLLPGGDVFVFPSHYDPFALVVTEAMACGLPVITASSVGAAEVIRNGENGFVLNSSDDLESLVSIVTRLMQDPAFCNTIRVASRATAESLSWSQMAEQYEALYERILRSKQTTSEASSIPST